MEEFQRKEPSFGTLEVTIVNLEDAAVEEDEDAFVQICCLTEETITKDWKRTKTEKGSSPSWHSTFSFDLESNLGKLILVVVKPYFLKSDLLVGEGQIQLPVALQQLREIQPLEVTLPVYSEMEVSGSLKLLLNFFPSKRMRGWAVPFKSFEVGSTVRGVTQSLLTTVCNKAITWANVEGFHCIDFSLCANEWRAYLQVSFQTNKEVSKGKTEYVIFKSDAPSPSQELIEELTSARVKCDDWILQHPEADIINFCTCTSESSAFVICFYRIPAKDETQKNLN